MPRGKAIDDFLQELRDYFQPMYPGFRGIERMLLEERNVRVERIMVMHDTAKTRGLCHPDYVIYKAGYEFRVDFRVLYTKPDGSFAHDLITGAWVTVANEQWSDEERHCAFGLDDLPSIPDDYCLVRANDRVVYEGPLGGVRIEAFINGTPALSTKATPRTKAAKAGKPAKTAKSKAARTRR